MELPVSYGEALDKLTILEIKLDKIKDSRRDDVVVEYNLLMEKLLPYFTEDSRYHYSILKDVNLKIWDMQDIFRESKEEKERISLCMKIIEDNDRRFRIKSKLNILFNSHLKEQKGYKKRKAFVLSHLGLGDCFTIVGAVRYLSTCYDEVKVVCKENYYENVKLLYKDDSTISILPIKDDKEISPNHGFPLKEFEKITEGYELFLCGYHKLDKMNTSLDTIPFCFYNDIDIQPNIFWDYFHVPETAESKHLHSLLFGKKYIVLHTSSSRGNILDVEIIEAKLDMSKDDILFLDINTNLYKPDHPFYNLANEFINKPLVYYKDTLIHADAIVVSDSCLFCMAINLPIKTDKCYFISRLINYDYFYEPQFGFSETSGKKKFGYFLDL